MTDQPEQQGAPAPVLAGGGRRDHARVGGAREAADVVGSLAQYAAGADADDDGRDGPAGD